jgi:hypothetical protein
VNQQISKSINQQMEKWKNGRMENLKMRQFENLKMSDFEIRCFEKSTTPHTLKLRRAQQINQPALWPRLAQQINKWKDLNDLLFNIETQV